MCRVKAKVIPGCTRRERIAYIKTAGGLRAEVIVTAEQVGPNHIVAAEVARDADADCVLIELPQETSSGDWRVWVKNNQILSA